MKINPFGIEKVDAPKQDASYAGWQIIVMETRHASIDASFSGGAIADVPPSRWAAGYDCGLLQPRVIQSHTDSGSNMTTAVASAA